MFIDPHNEQYSSYHPFSADTLLTQTIVTALLAEDDIVYCCGGHLYNLLVKLKRENINYEIFKCPCCSKKIDIIEKEKAYFIEKYFGFTWRLLNGISGNY